MERPTEHIGPQPQQPQAPTPIRREIRGLPREAAPTVAETKDVPVVVTESELELDFLDQPSQASRAPQAPSAPASSQTSPAPEQAPFAPSAPSQPQPEERPETTTNPILARKKATYGGVAAILVMGGLGGMFFNKKQDANGPQTPAATGENEEIGQKGENQSEQPTERKDRRPTTPQSLINPPGQSGFEASLNGERNGTDEASQLIQRARTQRLTEAEIYRLTTSRQKDFEGLRSELEKTINEQREILRKEIEEQRNALRFQEEQKQNALQALVEQRRDELERRIQQVRNASDELINQSRRR